MGSGYQSHPREFNDTKSTLALQGIITLAALITSALLLINGCDNNSSSPSSNASGRLQGNATSSASARNVKSNASAIVGSVDTPGHANDIYITGPYAYVADGETGLQMIRIELK